MTGRIVTVDFHDATLFAVERAGGVFVALRPICDSLGLDPKKQRERVQRDPILSEGGAVVALPSPGGPQETFCLRLDLVHGWLFTIDESRVREGAKERVLTYKRECYATLYRTFYGAEKGAQLPTFSEPKDNEVASLRLVTEARHTFGTAAAGQLWFKLGLPIVPAMRADPRQRELPDPVGQAVAA